MTDCGGGPRVGRPRVLLGRPNVDDVEAARSLLCGYSVRNPSVPKVDRLSGRRVLRA